MRPRRSINHQQQCFGTRTVVVSPGSSQRVIRRTIGRGLLAMTKKQDFLWHWVHDESVASLPVSWRFSELVCKFLRDTSTNTSYGKKAKIWAADELPDYDGTNRHLLVQTRMRVVVYKCARFHAAEGKARTLLGQKCYEIVACTAKGDEKVVQRVGGAYPCSVIYWTKD